MGESSDDIRQKYASLQKKQMIFGAGLFAALILLIGIGVTLGSAGISWMDSYCAVFAGLFPGTFEVSELTMVIVWDYRLHRVLFAVAAGFGLAVAGTVMQGVLRNPLASPFTLGISSAAACGATIAIVLGAGFAGGEWLIVSNAFIFSLLAAGAVFAMARSQGMNTTTMVLGGIAIMYLFSAVTSLLQYIGTAEMNQAVVFWMFGSMDKSSWGKLGLVTLILVVVIPYLILKAWDINALSEGDEVATSLGVNVKHSVTAFMLLSAFITASIICFTGTIGFIGLVAPHITRLCVGVDHRVLIPLSGLVGAVLLLTADSLARTIIAPTILPVGIMMAFIGVPFFIYLFMTRRGEGW
ncbi:MAG: iron ABC transporter permease [Methanogenium sp.]|nr:iron ABC transporter permease [Methanogenium sp.]